MAGKQPGDTIEVEFYRGDDKRTVEVKLGERPEQLGGQTQPEGEAEELASSDASRAHAPEHAAGRLRSVRSRP